MSPAAVPARSAISKSTVLHWYDLTCPFCYVAQSRDHILEKTGMQVIQRPYRAHPEVPAEGIHMGPRSGPMYDNLLATAKREGLPLNFNDKLPPSRLALGAAEWARLNAPEAFHTFQKGLYAAHFAERKDISDASVVEAKAKAANVPVDALKEAMKSGETDKLLQASEKEAREYGIHGTPFWWSNGETISGAQGASVFEAMAARHKSEL